MRCCWPPRCPAVIVIGSKFSTDAITKIINFAAFGIYLAFQMVVFAALRARLKGWVPSRQVPVGPMGAAGQRCASVMPRRRDDQHNLAPHPGPWFDNWIVALATRRGGNRVGVHGFTRCTTAARAPTTPSRAGPTRRAMRVGYAKRGADAYHTHAHHGTGPVVAASGRRRTDPRVDRGPDAPGHLRSVRSLSVSAQGISETQGRRPGSARGHHAARQSRTE